MIEYVICQAISYTYTPPIDDLTLMVNKLTKQGWVPCGSVSSTFQSVGRTQSWSLLQPMTRITEQPNAR